MTRCIPQRAPEATLRCGVRGLFFDALQRRYRWRYVCHVETGVKCYTRLVWWTLYREGRDTGTTPLPSNRMGAGFKAGENSSKKS